MAINVTFNGSTIWKPGSYSSTTVDLGGGFPIGPAGLIAVIGEADAGAPGSQEINIFDNRFTGDQVSTIRAKYRQGPLVDAALMMFAPASDAAIPGGANTLFMWKTNASVRASLAVPTAMGTLRAREWGVGGNRITAKIVSSAEVAPVIVGDTIAAFGVALNEAEFWVAVSGEEPIPVALSATSGDHADLATLLVEINAALVGTDVEAVSGGTDKVTLRLKADATAHQNGIGKVLEIGGADIALIGHAAESAFSSVEPSVSVFFDNKRDQIIENDIIGGDVVLSIGRTSAGGVSEAWVEITASQIRLHEAAVSPTPAHIFVKASYPVLSELVTEINLRTGWSASLADPLYGQLNPEVLDQVTVGALSDTVEPARIKKDAFEWSYMCEMSAMIELINEPVIGLPDAMVETSLSGGSKGGTSSVDIVNALEKFTKFHVNFIIPLFARSATDDIADGLTDPSSTYTIDGIHQAVKTHISLMKSTKKRSERQAVLAYKASYVDCQKKSAELADGRLQLVIQDIRQNDSQGNIKWFQPWALAAVLTGARAGAAIGEPLTFKYMNIAGLRHTAQSMSTADADIVIDFDPDLQSDQAIQSNITFLEAAQGGGFRVVVDNTTYGRDGNWVWNRGHTIYAADIAAYNFRSQMESLFVGRKNVVTVNDVVTAASAILGRFKDAGMIVPSKDAPAGFKELTVQIVGNEIRIAVTLILVEGIEFVLTEFSLKRVEA